MIGKVGKHLIFPKVFFPCGFASVYFFVSGNVYLPENLFSTANYYCLRVCGFSQLKIFNFAVHSSCFDVINFNIKFYVMKNERNHN